MDDYIIHDGKHYRLEGFIAWAESARRYVEQAELGTDFQLNPKIFRPESWADLFGIPVEEFESLPDEKRVSVDSFVGKVDGYPNLPDEVSTQVAAKILGISKDTVLRLKASGVLAYRNIAPPTSSRAVFRFSLESVLALRTGYTQDWPQHRSPNVSCQKRKRSNKKGASEFKHFRYDD